MVLDFLSPHTAAYYGGLFAKVACELVGRFEFVYTPVHVSWLNTTESERWMLVEQCLKRKSPDVSP